MIARPVQYGCSQRHSSAMQLGSPMHSQSVETAIEAANVALTGRRNRAVSGFASIELREGQPGEPRRWEVLVGLVVAVAALAGVLGAWLY